VTIADNTADTDKFLPLPLIIKTPIRVEVLKHYLTGHPDKDLVQFLIHGFSHGFDIMYAGPIISTFPRNLKSARDRPGAVTSAIYTEVERGHTAGPFASPPFNVTHCSPLGAVQKDPKSPKVRLILDLSQPSGSSVNEGILEEYCTVKYTSFDTAVDMIKKIGFAANMCKIDIQHAFRLCPVRKVDWPLLCFYWNNAFYVDTRLPFGSRSSPGIFNNFADALCWILISKGIRWLVHYLDDFLFSAPTPDLAKEWMDTFIHIFSEIGVPIAKEKTIGPATRVTFLGIEIDTVQQCIRLPEDKLSGLLTLLKHWEDKKKCTKRELLSLIGSLSFAAKVVKPGRIFLRRLIDLSTSVSKLHHHISLNLEAKSDIKWWLQFLPAWNGIAIFQEDVTTADSLHLFTDASDIGLGGVFKNKWFACPWPASFSKFHINFKEVFAIHVAISIWGQFLCNKQILVYCDNLSIVSVWKSGSCKDPNIMKVIRALFFSCASFNINLLTKHIEGKKNNLADALSRMQVGKFHSYHPMADDDPSPIPVATWNF
jgi:hypothetical protein